MGLFVPTFLFPCDIVSLQTHHDKLKFSFFVYFSKILSFSNKKLILENKISTTKFHPHLERIIGTLGVFEES